MVEITKCPPGRARGAGDLQSWSFNRMLGRSGVNPKDDPVKWEEKQLRPRNRSERLAAAADRIIDAGERAKRRKGKQTSFADYRKRKRTRGRRWTKRRNVASG